MCPDDPQDRPRKQQRTGRNRRKPKRYQFEVGRKGLFFYGLCLFMALTWMFVFGILVGRGIPLVSSEEFSLRAHLLRFIGLGPQVAKKAEPEAEEHFDSPRTMLETLDYYLSLTRKQNDGPPPLRTVTNMPVPSAKPPRKPQHHRKPPPPRRRLHPTPWPPPTPALRNIWPNISVFWFLP